jgi:hypothetical protein
MRDPVSVSLLVSSSELKATLNRTMIVAATSAKETRYRSRPSASLGLPIRSLKMTSRRLSDHGLSSSISLAQVRITEVDFSLAATAMTPNWLNLISSAAARAFETAPDMGFGHKHTACNRGGAGINGVINAVARMAPREFLQLAETRDEG